MRSLERKAKKRGDVLRRGEKRFSARKIERF